MHRGMLSTAVEWRLLQSVPRIDADGHGSIPRDAGRVSASRGTTSAGRDGPEPLQARGTHAAHGKAKSRLKPSSSAILVDALGAHAISGSAHARCREHPKAEPTGTSGAQRTDVMPQVLAAVRSNVIVRSQPNSAWLLRRRQVPMTSTRLVSKVANRCKAPLSWYSCARMRCTDCGEVAATTPSDTREIRARPERQRAA
jgi:hypothetical protein